MTIYTRTGDEGKTSLFGGGRVSKADNQVEAYGCVDELSSFIGVLLLHARGAEKSLLSSIQKQLYDIMAMLAGSTVSLEKLEKPIDEFESKIDALDKKLPHLHRFILPQGTESAVWYHVVRTVCRRAERHVTMLLSQKKVRLDRQLLKLSTKYLNRLSDLMFIMARYKNRGHEVVT